MNAAAVPTVSVNVSLSFPLQRLAHLLTSAFEGGSNYWIEELTYVVPDAGPDAKVVARQHAPELGLDELTSRYPAYVLPFIGEGYGVTIRVDEDSEVEPGKRDYLLDRAAIEKGIQKMAELKPGKGGHHFPNFLQENDDAETADVFLQCCLFGAIYLS